jgi:Chondroitinase B/Carbohydrate binding module (family 6)
MAQSARLVRWLVAGAAGAVVVAASVAAVLPTLAAMSPPGVHVVTSISALQSALGSAAPGDVIQVADGIYTAGGPISISRAGTASAPITVQAQHVGGATITGSGGFSIGRGASYVVLSGFQLTGARGLSIPVGATHVQVTRNTFQMAGSVQYWLTVAGDDAQIDHNTFQHKSTLGNFIEVVGPGGNGMAQRTWIHHNYFLDQSFKGGNGGESIRVGLSGRQHSSAKALVEYNLFEQCDGDLEVISVKSTDDTIRYNTLRNSKGTITLRHGWNNRVDGNYLIGSNTGIRMFGNNHMVVNNVVENSTGPALSVGGGEVRDDTTSSTDHEAVDHALVAYNTFVNDHATPIQVGDGGKQFEPSDVTIANNIVSGTGSAVGVTGGSTGIGFQGNMLNGVSGGAMSAGGFHLANPKLVLDAGGVYRLSSGSPAIGAAVGSFPQVTADMDTQARSNPSDVGADQFTGSGARREPLTTADVGPAAGGGSPGPSPSPSPSVSAPPPPSPTPSPSGPSKPVRYEAEKATLFHAVVATNHTGFSGTGFVDYGIGSGGYLQWTVAAAATGTATLTIRYANGGATSRPVDIAVNGKVVTAGCGFPPTGGWDTWQNLTLTVPVTAGTNTVRATATGSGGPNTDYLDMS